MRELAVGETAHFDLRQMLAEQKPDNKDVVLPKSVKGGQFHWSVFGGSGAGSPRLLGRSEVVSLSKKVSSSYSCPSCCPDSGPFGGINTPGTVPIDGFLPVGTNGEMTDCNGYTTNMGGLWMDSWWVENSSMCSVNPTTGISTEVHGYSVGETYLNAEWYAFYWDPGPDDCYRHDSQQDDQQPMQVTPRIDSISPTAGLVGSTVDVIIKGKGFSGGLTPTINTISGISTSVQSSSDTEIHARFTIDVNAAGGNRDVAVSTGASSTSNGLSFLVQIPSRLALTFHPNAPSGVGPLKTPVDEDIKDLAGTTIAQHQCGVYRNFAYALLDQTGGRIVQGFTINEQFGSYSGPFGSPTAQSANIAPSSVVPDIQNLTRTFPGCINGGEVEQFLIGYTVTVGGRTFDLSTIVFVHRGNDNGTLKADATIIQP